MSTISSYASEKLHPDLMYKSALAKFELSEYDSARVILESLIRDNTVRPNLADNCYYWIGECYYAKRAFLDAISCFYKVLEFPRANKAESARMKIALAWYNLGDKEKSCAEVNAILKIYPESEFRKRALRLKGLACPSE
jgi:tetratricopeptide (TPR) repeat protein